MFTHSGPHGDKACQAMLADAEGPSGSRARNWQYRFQTIIGHCVPEMRDEAMLH